MVRADTLPEEKREAFLHAFGKFKQKVLWKWENETMPNKPSNVFIRKWLPQRDILCKLTFNHSRRDFLSLSIFLTQVIQMF